MTARPLRQTKSHPQLRVIAGSNALAGMRPGWWFGFTLAVAAILFAMVTARTSLDRSGIELGQLERQISEEQADVAELQIEIANLSAAVRIGPLAEEMGMVYPDDREVLVVDGVVADRFVANQVASQNWAMESQP